jgi:cysteine-rich repeat protein
MLEVAVASGNLVRPASRVTLRDAPHSGDVKMIRNVSSLRALCLCGLLAAACGDSSASDDGAAGDAAVQPDSGPEDGGAADGGADAGEDAGADAGQDAGSDAGEDAGDDAGSDAGAGCTDACTADETRCTDNDVEKCVEGSDGCLAFALEDACDDASEHCDDSAEPASCQPGCVGDLDCDGVLTAADCDDGDPALGAVAADADCDAVLTAADCDDGNPTLGAVAADVDCDGVLTAADCDDGDAGLGAVAADADCDGVLTATDCDDGDPTLGAVAADLDCDGALTASDCDDADASLGASALDTDCDGALALVDCDDTDAVTADDPADADCDGTPDVVTFVKADYADPTDVANQDCITASVCITRGDSSGLYNAVTESSYGNGPEDVEYAMGHVGDGADLADWGGTIRNATWWVMQPTTMHLITDDLWFDTLAYSWTPQGQGGGFATARTQATFFEKLDNADPTLPANQDCLTPGVCLTRGATKGLYNAAVESAFGTPDSSPVGTRWAPKATADAQPGDYTSFTAATGSNPQSAIGQVMSLHVEGTGVYYDVVFTAYTGSNGGGGFAYWRSRALVVGCTDSAADNFDPRATVDDGYCGDWQRVIIPSDSDPLDAANQDCITPDVCLTRGSSEGLFNAAVEVEYGELNEPSPLFTRWANLPTASATPGDYTDWESAVDDCPPCQGDSPMSLWIPTEGLLFDVVVVRWPGNGTGGGVTYLRRPVALPGSCGDGDLDVGEACDDANADDTDACMSNCLDAGCGNQVVEPGEECDDGAGNRPYGATCRDTCLLVGCGDGIIDPNEACDDGNPDAGDGCDAACVVEGGFTCIDEPSLCYQPCGASSAADLGALRPSDGACLLAFGAPAARGAAEVGCVAHGGQLASIADATDNATVLFLARHVGDPVWIGLSDLATEGSFEWDDGSALSYTNWGGGEPNDAGANEDCGQLSPSSGAWNDGVCEDSQPYVCSTLCGNGAIDGSEACDEGDSNDNAPGSTCRTNCKTTAECGDAILDPGEDCDDGNLTNGDGCADDCLFVCGSGSGADAAVLSPTSTCYAGFEAQVDYDAAESACVGLGGHLVTIGSSTDNTALSTFIGTAGLGTPWIGFDDQASEGNFVWTSGAAVTYTGWNSGEPNDSGGEDCTETSSSGGWNDLPCTLARSYVCELP